MGDNDEFNVEVEAAYAISNAINTAFINDSSLDKISKKKIETTRKEEIEVIRYLVKLNSIRQLFGIVADIVRVKTDKYLKNESIQKHDDLIKRILEAVRTILMAGEIKSRWNIEYSKVIIEGYTNPYIV